MDAGDKGEATATEIFPADEIFAAAAAGEPAPGLRPRFAPLYFCGGDDGDTTDDETAAAEPDSEVVDGTMTGVHSSAGTAARSCGSIAS